jgi:hypothetical protein
MSRRFWIPPVLMIFFSLGLTGAEAQPSPTHEGEFRVLYNFTNGVDGCCIYAGVARDHAGNLYGVAYENRGLGGGDLFELVHATTGYRIRVLHDFTYADGECTATPVIDQQDNVFGVCQGGAGSGNGTLWEYTHDGKFSILHQFILATDGDEPMDSVQLDGFGNIYGTTYTYGPGTAGTLWKYSLPSGPFQVLHAFSNGDDGGLLPTGPVLDGRGNIWGTTLYGPNCYYCGNGTLWKYDLLSGTLTTVLDLNTTPLAQPTNQLAMNRSGDFFGTAGLAHKVSCGVVYEFEKKQRLPAADHLRILRSEWGWLRSVRTIECAGRSHTGHDLRWREQRLRYGVPA